MTLDIDDRDLSLFRELYFVLAAFADEPANTISRIGGGCISIPEDQANDLGHFRRAILETYPAAADLQVMRVVAEIDAIFSHKSRGGDSFEEWFWTNKGFLEHPDWDKIRFCLRTALPWIGRFAQSNADAGLSTCHGGQDDDATSIDG